MPARSDRAFADWKKQSLGASERTVYRGDRLRAVAMPLGGLGTGSIALCGDGGLRQWQIFNQVNHAAHVPHSFFAIRARQGREPPVARVLQSRALYDDSGFEPAVTCTDHVVPAESRRLLEALPGVAEIEFVGEYPIAQLGYADPALPVEVSLEAFSPMIPLNSKDSALPLILLRFSVTNPQAEPVEVSLAATLQNAVGYDGEKPIREVRCPDYGGNVNVPIHLRGLTGVHLTNARVPGEAAGAGSMVLAACEEEASLLEQWDDLELLWRDFRAEGRFSGNGRGPSSKSGRTWNAGLAVPFRLEPGASRTVTFMLAWHFPNRYVNWNQSWIGVKDAKSRFWLGNMYANWFRDAVEVAEYARDNLERLAEETALFRDTFYDSTLPYWLLDAVSSQTSIVRSPTVLWTEDGNFHGFEGCCGASTSERVGGCCPLNCTHVWNYEQSLSRLYPEVEQTMRRTDLLVQLSPEGAIPHRTALPLHLPRWKDEGPGSQMIAADGHFGTILKTYREYLVSGDRAFLDEVWPAIKSAMAYGMARWDPDGDGVLDGPQWNTYDLNFYGANTFCSGFYLAALRAAEEMARIEGEAALAESFRARFERGRAKLDELLWNGQYYQQKHDAGRHPEVQYGPGCLSDQMIGQWWAHLLELGYIFPADRVRRALAAIWEHNFRRDFAGFAQQRAFASEHDRGLLNCTWPRGGRPEKPMYYCDEVWTGIEYQVASHMLMEGLVEPALLIVKAARDRYDGRQRSPWNEIECGDHYARAMSSWALLEAAAGFHYSAPEKRLRFAPKLAPESFQAFFVTESAWGSFAQRVEGRRQIETLTVAWGRLNARVFEFERVSTARRLREVRVTVRGRRARARWEETEGRLIVRLPRALSLSAGERIDLALVAR